MYQTTWPMTIPSDSQILLQTSVCVCVCVSNHTPRSQPQRDCECLTKSATYW